MRTCVQSLELKDRTRPSRVQCGSMSTGYWRSVQPNWYVVCDFVGILYLCDTTTVHILLKQSTKLIANKVGWKYIHPVTNICIGPTQEICSCKCAETAQLFATTTREHTTLFFQQKPIEMGSWNLHFDPKHRCTVRGSQQSALTVDYPTLTNKRDSYHSIVRNLLADKRFTTCRIGYWSPAFPRRSSLTEERQGTQSSKLIRILRYKLRPQYLVPASRGSKPTAWIPSATASRSFPSIEPHHNTLRCILRLHNTANRLSQPYQPDPSVVKAKICWNAQ